MYLKNCWYVAAWGRDIGRTLVACTIIDEPIVLFRQADGRPVALENACPHRKLPLSMGRLKGDHIECGYHGLQFDFKGKCVAAPTQNRIPPRAQVRSYPVAEKFGLLWIWMGAPDLAEEALLYSVENYGHPGWGVTEGGSLEFNCNYLYVVDNLLDPSHVAWVHETSFAAPGTDNAPLATAALDDGMIVSRWITDQPPPPYYAPFIKFEGRCDRYQHYEVRVPGIAINKSIFTPPGTGGNNRPLHDKAFVIVSYTFMTPISEDKTRYFWFQHRNTDPDDESISERLNAGAMLAFGEDKAVLEAVHLGMTNKRTGNIDLGIDAGALRFRRKLQNMVSLEHDAADRPARRPET